MFLGFCWFSCASLFSRVVCGALCPSQHQGSATPLSFLVCVSSSGPSPARVPALAPFPFFGTERSDRIKIREICMPCMPDYWSYLRRDTASTCTAVGPTFPGKPSVFIETKIWLGLVQALCQALCQSLVSKPCVKTCQKSYTRENRL